MALSAYSTTVKAHGPSAAMTDEATTSLGSQRYQVTNTARQILDPTVAVTVKDGATPLAAADFVVDYCFGIVTLTNAPSGAVTVTANYLTPVTVTEAKEFSISLAAGIEDSSYFVTDGYKRKTVTLLEASGTIGMLQAPHVDLDFGGGTTRMNTLLTSRTTFILEINMASTEKFRAFVRLEGIDDNSDAAAVYQSELKWVAAPVLGSGQTENATFSFGT